MARTPGSNTIMYLPLTSSTTTQDKSGNGYNMTNKNGATFGTYYGVSCAHFVDNTSYLQYNGNPLSGTPGAFTVSNWFYIESTPNQYHQNQWGFGYGGTENPTSSIMLWGNYTKLMLGGWSNDHDTGYSYSLNKWYHVAVTYTPGTVKTYVNGKLVDSWSKTYSGIKTNYVRIGHYVYDRTIEDSGINGCISEFIVENKTRTATEVREYYNSTAWKYGLADKPTIYYGSSPIKEIYLGNPGGSRLPSAYQEVEYIENTNSQYINTGVIASSNVKIEMKFGGLTTNSGNVNSRMFSGGNGWKSSHFVLGYSVQNSEPFYGWGSTEGVVATTGFLSSIYTVVMSSDGIYINGTKSNSVSGTFTSSYTMYLFAGNQGGSMTEPAKCKIYYTKMWNSGTLVRDFVPCYRKSDNVIGLYDLVNNQFYTNSGSGTFTKGANVTQDYTPIKEVRYSNSSGELKKIRPSITEYSWDFTKYTSLPSGWSSKNSVSVNSNGLRGTGEEMAIYYNIGSLSGKSKVTLYAEGTRTTTSWAGWDLLGLNKGSFSGVSPLYGVFGRFTYSSNYPYDGLALQYSTNSTTYSTVTNTTASPAPTGGTYKYTVVYDLTTNKIEVTHVDGNTGSTKTISGTYSGLSSYNYVFGCFYQPSSLTNYVKKLSITIE